jgi:4,5-DOPA dioxygenase extradiol
MQVFSAHWDTKDEILVSDWSPRNPILYDYYGFPKHMYEHDFNSHGDAELSRKIVSLLTIAGLKARLLGKTENRGLDGRDMESGYGIDHGVMVRTFYSEVLLRPIR